MEASVCGGIPIHAVLREGISGDRVTALYGILNGTSNYILTEIEQRGATLRFDVLAEAQRLGYAEADPSADVDGSDARSKLAILAALAFGEKITPSDIYTEGIRRIMPVDFQYAHQLGHTIRLICAARQTPSGLILSVRPSLIPKSTILAGVQGAYNAVWVRGQYGEDTFYYGRGAGPLPTGVAVVSDLMRVAREIRSGSPERVSPFAHERLGEYKPIPVTLQQVGAIICASGWRTGRASSRGWPRCWRDKQISLDAVLQIPAENWRDLPFVITVEPTSEQSIREAMAEMSAHDFLLEPPLAMPMEEASMKRLLIVRYCCCCVAAAAQVADKANEQYKTKEGREAVARRLGRSQSRRDAEAARNRGRDGSEAGHDGGRCGHRRRLHAALPEPRGGADGPGDRRGYQPGFSRQGASCGRTTTNAEECHIRAGHRSDDPKLPADTLNAVLVLDVYHHFDYPEAMLAGHPRQPAVGRQAVYRGLLSSSPNAMPDGRALEHIRLDRDDVIKEVEANGFRLVCEAAIICRGASTCRCLRRSRRRCVIIERKTHPTAPERWLSGRKQRFAKPS